MGFVDKSRKASKGLMNICILDIIGEATEESPVTQEQTRRRLEDEYGIKADRKSVRRHLSCLVEGISGIRYTEKPRTVNGVKDGSAKGMESHFRNVIAAMEAGEVHVDTFRMDRMTDAVALDEPRDGIDPSMGLRLRGARWNRLDVQEYIRDNPSLASGHSVHARFRLTEGVRCSISDAIDHFGKGNVRVHCENPGAGGEPRSYIVSVRVNDGDMRDFALRNTPDVEVLKPDGLREEIREAHRRALEGPAGADWRRARQCRR